MATIELSRLDEIKWTMEALRKKYGVAYAKWSAANLERIALENQMRALQDERESLLQGQFMFDQGKRKSVRRVLR